MGKITPTLTLSSNSSAATKNPGPLSVALTLSATDQLDVDRVTSDTKSLNATTSLVLDGSALLAIDSDTGVPGTHGGFLYLKNVSATDLDIFVGMVADGNTDALSSNDDAQRSFTLKQNEWAWVPWDCTGDLTAQGEDANCLLEYWFFNRSNA